MKKRTIKQTAYGNWYGYESRRRVIAFADMPTHTAEQAAKEWLDRSSDKAKGGNQ